MGVERRLAVCGLLVALALPTAAHEYHASSAEIEFNRESGRLEIALQVIPEDLETALSAGRDRPVRLEATPDVDALITAYLADRFRVTGPSGEPQPILWVGKEVSYRAAWLYFEIEVDGKVAWTLDNRVLFDVSESQINTVEFRDGERRSAWIFTMESKPVALGLG